MQSGGGGESGGRHVCLPSPYWPSPVGLVVRMSDVCVTASLCHMAPSACRSWRCVSLLYLLFATEARESISCFGVLLRCVCVCGRGVFADAVWRVCVGLRLHRVLDSWLRCVTKTSPASCVFGYPAWFANMSRGGVRQTTVDGLPRVIKFAREAFVDVVWKGVFGAAWYLALSVAVRNQSESH